MASERERLTARGLLSPLAIAAFRRGELRLEAELRWHEEFDAKLAGEKPEREDLLYVAVGAYAQALHQTAPLTHFEQDHGDWKHHNGYEYRGDRRRQHSTRTIDRLQNG